MDIKYKIICFKDWSNQARFNRFDVFFLLVFFATRWKYVFRGSRWFLFTWRTFLFAASFVLAISSLIEKVPPWSPAADHNSNPQFNSNQPQFTNQQRPTQQQPKKEGQSNSTKRSSPQFTIKPTRNHKPNQQKPNKFRRPQWFSLERIDLWRITLRNTKYFWCCDFKALKIWTNVS